MTKCFFFQNELQNMIRAGVIGFKAYLIDSGIEEYPNVKSIELDDIFSTLNGSDVVIAVSTYCFFFIVFSLRAANRICNLFSVSR